MNKDVHNMKPRTAVPLHPNGQDVVARCAKTAGRRAQLRSMGLLNNESRTILPLLLRVNGQKHMSALPYYGVRAAPRGDNCRLAEAAQGNHEVQEGGNNGNTQQSAAANTINAKRWVRGSEL